MIKRIAVALALMAGMVSTMLGINASPASAQEWHNGHSVTCNGWTYNLEWYSYDWFDSGGYHRQTIEDVYVTPGIYNTNWSAFAFYESSQGVHWGDLINRTSNAPWHVANPYGANARYVWNPVMKFQVGHNYLSGGSLCTYTYNAITG